MVGSLMIISLQAITAESGGERILKIGQHLAKLWARVGCPVFWLTGYISYTSLTLHTIYLLCIDFLYTAVSLTHPSLTILHCITFEQTPLTRASHGHLPSFRWIMPFSSQYNNNNNNNNNNTNICKVHIFSIRTESEASTSFLSFLDLPSKR